LGVGLAFGAVALLVAYPGEEVSDEAGFVLGGGWGWVLDGGDGAVEWVEDDVDDGGFVFEVRGVGFEVGGVGAGLPGEGGCGDAEAVEEEAGALDLDGLGGDAGEDVVDGEADGGAVLEQGDGEDGFLGEDVEVFGRAAGGLVVEAEGLAAEGGGAAAAAVDADVAAAEAAGGGGFGGGVGLLRHVCLLSCGLRVEKA
jgi:hypothetical protein